MTVETAADLAGFFDPSGFAVSATYMPLAGGEISCAVIPSRGDSTLSFGAADILPRSGGGTLLVRKSEVSAPRAGDRFIVGPDTLVVVGEPLIDSERTVWTVEVSI